MNEARPPAPADARRDGEHAHKRALAWVMDQSRWDSAQRGAAAESWASAPMAGEAVVLLGIPGHLWLGKVTEIRSALWKDRGPYDAPEDATEQRKKDAAANWAYLRNYLTQGTGNLVNAGSGIVWVRDEYSPEQISQAQFDSLREAAHSVTESRMAVIAGPGMTLPCRYRDAMGCEASYTNPQSWHYHTEKSADHSGRDAIPLTACPPSLCGIDIGSFIGRNRHIAVVHAIPANSPERMRLDMQQTKELWDAREARRATFGQPAQVTPDAASKHAAAYGALRDILLENEQLWLENTELRGVVAEQSDHIARLTEEADLSRRMRELLT